MAIGMVKWFCNRKGYGFISLLDELEKDVFIHHCEILGKGYNLVYQGQIAEFDVIENARGLRAVSIQIDVDEMTLQQHADKIAKAKTLSHVDKGRNTKQGS